MRLYNSEIRAKEELETLSPGTVLLYVCGVTVYAEAHVGHIRAALSFDIVLRHLLSRGYEVKYVRNFTDVDDKIINKAIEEGVGFREIAGRYEEDYHWATDSLFMLRPDHEPRVSEYMDEIIVMVGQLIDNGHGYVVDGDVFYSVASCPDYGRLSGRRLEDQEQGARVDVDSRKRHPFDFALWKSSKPGEPCWDSPWGPGRPGWHIECSVMSSELLGERFDIHGGGIDLIFPHHENEIAQTEGATGHGPCVRHWMHNGHLTVNSEKMGKSLGNFFGVGDIIVRYHPESLRLFYLTAHYRAPLDFSEQAVQEAEARLERLYGALAELDRMLGDHVELRPARADGSWGREHLYAPVEDPLQTLDPSLFDGAERGLFHQCEKVLERFGEAMDDDFNTAGALGHLFDFIRKVNRWLGGEPDFSVVARVQLARAARDRILRAASTLGVLNERAESFFSGLRERRLRWLGIEEREIQQAIDKRLEARSQRDFAAADRIRDQLAERGIALKDSPQGTTWTVQRDLSPRS
ncbi:MAG: cysteine--tRNA ligase [Rickettsiales bacterium]|nr:cysteine--tRNA ligase [Rickettsiales bacterium]